MSGSGMSLRGLPELHEQLRGLEPKLQKKALSRAMRTAFKPVLDAARVKAPKRTGLLQKRIRMTSVRANGVVAVGLTLSNKPATLEGGKAEARNWVWYEHGIPSRGIPAHPFLRPALDANAEWVTNMLGAALSREIDALLAPGAGE